MTNDNFSRSKDDTGSHYGGRWTREKLSILESYLNAYTTALKNQRFDLVYIDAFAGSGTVGLPQSDPDATAFIRGSAARAVNIRDKKFDRLLFIEKDPARCRELEHLMSANRDRNISIFNTDANRFLNDDLRCDWRKWRGVLFLDPFATEVTWSTIEAIAGFDALDTWILFPVYAISRMLPKTKQPDDIAIGWATKLTAVYGDERWRDLYRQSPQQDLFGGVEFERQPGVEGLLEIYKKKLERLFGNRFLSQSRTLRNSTNAALFELLFCVGSSSPKAIRAAKGISRHILEKL